LRRISGKSAGTSKSLEYFTADWFPPFEFIASKNENFKSWLFTKSVADYNFHTYNLLQIRRIVNNQWTYRYAYCCCFTFLLASLIAEFFKTMKPPTLLDLRTYPYLRMISNFHQWAELLLFWGVSCRSFEVEVTVSIHSILGFWLQEKTQHYIFCLQIQEGQAKIIPHRDQDKCKKKFGSNKKQSICNQLKLWNIKFAQIISVNSRDNI
jgi:hypothetical protein